MKHSTNVKCRCFNIFKGSFHFTYLWKWWDSAEVLSRCMQRTSGLACRTWKNATISHQPKTLCVRFLPLLQCSQEISFNQNTFSPASDMLLDSEGTVKDQLWDLMLFTASGKNGQKLEGNVLAKLQSAHNQKYSSKLENRS